METKRKFPTAEKEEVSYKKHTLDSDEEDSDDYEKDEINGSDIEGEEDGVANVQDEVKITPFNMREELQEGHFDKDGHYHWNKDADIKDNWLDNIDWIKVKNDKNFLNAQKDEDSNDSSITPTIYNESLSYAKVLNFMQPHETVQQTIQRLGKNRTKITSAERLRRKKQGIKDEAAEKITSFTELTNEILTKTGNMDIYQETYAQIKNKINNLPSTSKKAQLPLTPASDTFDMYADDFADKEKLRLEAEKQDDNGTQTSATSTAAKSELRWEFKWKQDDADVNLQGPYTTEQMLKWSQENYFQQGVYVRKVGETKNLYSSNRIDFDLYL